MTDPLTDLPGRDLRQLASMVRQALVAGNTDADRVRHVRLILGAFSALGEAQYYYSDLMARMNDES